MQVLYNCSLFKFTQFILDLRTFVAKSALPRLRALEGSFGPKFGGRRHQNILLDWDFDHVFLFSDCVVPSEMFGEGACIPQV